MIWNLLEIFMDIDKKIFLICEYIFFSNIYYQIEENVPYHILYQLRNFQYELCDILIPYFKDGYDVYL